MYFHAVKMRIAISNQAVQAMGRIRPSRRPDAEDAFRAGYLLGCAETDKEEALDRLLRGRP